MSFTFFKNALRYRPLSWFAMVIRHEIKTSREQRRYNAWLQSDDYRSHLRFRKWQEDRGDEKLRNNYPLTEHSVVFDVGGYKGEFASDVYCKYNCEIFVFEPMPDFYEIIRQRFLKNNRVHTYCMGLSNQTGTAEISISDVSSSLFIKSESAKTIQLKNIIEFVQENDIKHVDLMKLNIEGAEYALLESLLDNGMITMFKNIQVQFHDFIVPDAPERMKNIQNRLAKTHTLTWQYEFVWENWELK